MSSCFKLWPTHFSRGGEKFCSGGLAPPVRGFMPNFTLQKVEGWSFRGVCVPVSGIKVRSLVELSVHSASHWWSAHCATRMLLFSEKLMSCCAADANGCLNLRRGASAPDGRVRAEWSRCPGSMARHVRNSAAPLRRSSAGWMPAILQRVGHVPWHVIIGTCASTAWTFYIWWWIFAKRKDFSEVTVLDHSCCYLQILCVLEFFKICWRVKIWSAILRPGPKPQWACRYKVHK